MTKRPVSGYLSALLAMGAALPMTTGCGGSDKGPEFQQTGTIDLKSDADRIILQLMPAIDELGTARFLTEDGTGSSSTQKPISSAVARAQADFAEKKRLFFDNQIRPVQEAVVAELKRRQNEKQPGTQAWLALDAARANLEYAVANAISAQAEELITRLMPAIEEMGKTKAQMNASTHPYRDGLAYQEACDTFEAARKQCLGDQPKPVQEAVLQELRNRAAKEITDSALREGFDDAATYLEQDLTRDPKAEDAARSR